MKHFMILSILVKINNNNKEILPTTMLLCLLLFNSTVINVYKEDAADI